LTETLCERSLSAMEVHFTPEQEAQLSQIAVHNGTRAEQLVREAALRLLQDDIQFREGVERGIAAAERGQFVDQTDVWANVEKILQS
jgi:predicted transcriptional regulator